MKKRCALLTCDDMSGYVSDEDILSRRIAKECDLDVSWHSWMESLDWGTFSYAIVRTTWDYTKHREQYLNTLKTIVDSGVTLFNPLHAIEWNSKKSYLRDLQKEGVNIVDSLFLSETSIEEALFTISSWEVDTILRKPLVGATSEGLKLIPTHSNDLKETLTDLKESKSEWFFQPFHSEIYAGEVSLVFFNKQFSHGLRKVPKKGDFRSQEEFGSEILAYEPSAMEIHFANDVLRHVREDLLYARVDFIKVNGKPQLMELEIVEPALYFRMHPKAMDNFINSLKQNIL